MSEININRLIGEFTGTLEGIMAWEIPSELKEKLQKKVDQLKAMPIHYPTDSGISNKPFKQASEFLEEMVLNEGGKKHELPELRTSKEYKIMVETIEKYAEQFSHQQPKPLSYSDFLKFFSENDKSNGRMMLFELDDKDLSDLYDLIFKAK